MSIHPTGLFTELELQRYQDLWFALNPDKWKWPGLHRGLLLPPLTDGERKQRMQVAALRCYRRKKGGARKPAAGRKSGWCVQHRDGWCLMKDYIKPEEGMDNVPTRCGHFVIFPFGFERRRPDCPECLALVANKEQADDEGTR